MSRPAKPEGSVYFLQKNQHWQCAYYDLDGKRRIKQSPVNTERGAHAYLAQLVRARDAGETVNKSITLAAYVPLWLESKRVAGCRPRTLEAYRERFAKHVLPDLGTVRLDRLAPSHLEKLYSRLLATPVEDASPPRTLSPTTVAHVHDALRAMLRSAKRKRHVGHIVTELVEPPRRSKHEARVLTIEEAQLLLTSTRGHRHGPLWAFMLGTGCRFGEAAGLTWSNVDLDKATALICQQVTRERERVPKDAGGKHKVVHVLSPVKTEAGRRTLYLQAFVVAALRDQQTYLTEARLLAGKKWKTEHPDLVFPTHLGALLQENHVLVTWHRHLKAIGLEGAPGQAPLRMHDLRHTRGTLMADEGEDTTTIQRTLGHARQSITADLYIGSVPKALRASADRYGALLDPSSRQHAGEDCGGAE